MTYIQRPYIFILNGLQKLTGRMREGVRETGLWITCALLAAYFPITDSFSVFHDDKHRMLACGVLVALLAVFGLRDRVRPVRWNALFVIATLAFAIWMLVARTQHGLKSGMTLHALFLLTVMPCFCLVWNSRGDYDGLFDKLATTLVIVGIAAYVSCLVIFPYAKDSFMYGRYTGMTWNPNNLGMHNAAVLAAAAYLIVRGKKRIAAAIAGGLAISLIYLSVSRTSLVAVVTVLIAFVILAARNACGAKHTRIWLAAGLLVILVTAYGGAKLLAVPTAKYDYRGIERIKEMTDSRNKYTHKELVEMGVIPAEESTSEANEAGVSKARRSGPLVVALRTALPAAQLRAPAPMVMPAEQAAEAPSAWEQRWGNNADLETLSTGRMHRYLYVIDQMNALGHAPGAEREFIAAGNVSIHNSILEFAYYSGAPAGAAFLLIEVLAVLFALVTLFGPRRREPGAYFGVLVVAFFWIMSLTEVATILSSRNVALMFYLIFPLLFASRKALWYN